jgi:hypothetical protein
MMRCPASAPTTHAPPTYSCAAHGYDFSISDTAIGVRPPNTAYNTIVREPNAGEAHGRWKCLDHRNRNRRDDADHPIDNR